MLQLQGRRALVVEDEFHLAKEACQTLRAAGEAIPGPHARFADVSRLEKPTATAQLVSTVEAACDP